MDKHKYYRLLFLISAIWNWFVGVSILFASLFMKEFVAELFGMVLPPSMVWFHVVTALIFVFGIGYYIVGRDLSKNHGVVLIGLLEKFLFFFILLIYVFVGDINIYVSFMTGVDLVFGILFVEFLLNYKNQTS